MQNTTQLNAGILGMEVYFPSLYVSQNDLEQYYQVSEGKYTIGLGQKKMGFITDCEDINSIALTVTKALLEKYQISKESVGKLEIGTETLLDKSKSLKTVLMDLFHGNEDIEGCTHLNACYGGTAALFNAIRWVESPSWDGRYAIVVAADIASYENGPARPTGGCGAVALLIGQNAQIVLETELCSTYSTNAYDFYKPHSKNEYPVVFGAESQKCYLQAIDSCYKTYARKSLKRAQKENTAKVNEHFKIDDIDYYVFHSPYNKLVQKGFARMIFNDFLLYPTKKEYESLKNYGSLNDIEKSYTDRELETELRKISAPKYNDKVSPSVGASQEIGNCYTASIFMNLACLICEKSSSLENKTVCMFSYGSGAVASLYSFKIREDKDLASSINGLPHIARQLNVYSRLSQRRKCGPDEFTRCLELRESAYGIAPFVPCTSIEHLYPGVYYLTGIDEHYRRSYSRKALNSDWSETCSLELPSQKFSSVSFEGSNNSNPTVEIIGISLGLPTLSDDEPVFQQDNIQKLLKGTNMIRELSDETKESMIKKNIMQVKKVKDPETREVITTKMPVDSVDKGIHLAGVLGHIDITKDYGIAPNLAECMDTACKIAVVAGLEALRDAGLVKGKCEDGQCDWSLSPETGDSTGVIYVASFPEMESLLIESEKALKPDYTFDRKLLFRLIVLANSQLAQIVGARGPNIHVNGACAGSTQAICIGADWLNLGRCERVVVIAGDNASGKGMIEWIGSGFRALGAATISHSVEEGALPFDLRRSGMILGAGAIGMVLQKTTSKPNACTISRSHSTYCTLLASQISNSAYHGASLDPTHIAKELTRFLNMVEKKYGINRETIAQNGIYFSHETFTHSSPAMSCANSELRALREALGDANVSRILVANTKGYTGHPMSVSFEDVTAVASLKYGILPSIANYKVQDPSLGTDWNFSKGGDCSDRKYALRLAAGFGSQLAFTLYSKN